MKRSKIVRSVIFASKNVKVVWGKSKKTYYAIVVAGYEQRLPPVTVERQRYTPAPFFTFELGSPVPEKVCEQQPHAESCNLRGLLQFHLSGTPCNCC